MHSTVMQSTSAILAYAFLAIAPLLFLGCLSYLVVLEMLFFRLRRKHPSYYESIGKPSLLLNNSISKSGQMMRYLLDKDYLVVPDAYAVRLGQISMRLLKTSRALFVAAVVLFAAFAITVR